MHKERQYLEVSSVSKQVDEKPEIQQEQTKETIQCSFSGSGTTHQVLGNKFGIDPKLNQTGMPDRLKTGLESLSGYDLSSVRVHYNSPKPRQIGALAYTQGADVHIGPGQQKHLPHEGWHAVQQMQGRVKPTFQLKGNLNLNNNVELEKEADLVGVKALQMQQ